LRSLKTLYLVHFKPVYLIFDQFEEIFILGIEVIEMLLSAQIQLFQEICIIII
jgi:hypothetical protein